MSALRPQNAGKWVSARASACDGRYALRAALKTRTRISFHALTFSELIYLTLYSASPRLSLSLSQAPPTFWYSYRTRPAFSATPSFLNKSTVTKKIQSHLIRMSQRKNHNPVYVVPVSCISWAVSLRRFRILRGITYTTGPHCTHTANTKSLFVSDVFIKL